MKNNTYYDNILRKVLTETLEERADNLMNKMNLPKLKPGKFDYVQEGETCESCGSEMTEGECKECGMREGEMLETRYVTSKGHKFSDEKKPLSRQDMEIGMDNMPGFDMEEYCAQYYDMDRERCDSYYNQNSGGELDERLYGNQRRIDKNKNGRIDREDFKMLRRKGERNEGRGECMECGSKSEMGENTKEKKKIKIPGIKTTPNKKDNPHKDPNPDVKENPKANNGKDIKESVLYKLEYINESALFTEEEIIDIIEGIINEENNFKKGPSPAGYVAYEKSHKGSGKEEDDYMKILSKKMTEYLKDGSKGKYDMNPKHFPKGNGQLAKMDKKAYEIDEEGTDFNMNIGGQMIPDYDLGSHPNKKTIEKQIKGSSDNGNNPKWANADDTGVNDKFAKYFEEDQLGKWKDESYGRVPSPVYNTKPKGKAKLKEEFDRMKGLIGYDRKTQ